LGGKEPLSRGARAVVLHGLTYDRVEEGRVGKKEKK